MKKTLALLLALSMIFSFAACGEKEAEEPKEFAKVTVIGANGKVAIAAADVELKDYNEDGKYDLDEALKAADEQYKLGGYESQDLGYGGLSLTMLDGDKSGAFGYYVNNEMIMTNLDQTEVKANDYVCAYVYQDMTGWSDAYSFFNVIETENGATLTVKYVGFDANWNTAINPLDGATITVDGVMTGIVTDENGTATINLDKATGTYQLSAIKDGLVLVPAICLITLK